MKILAVLLFSILAVAPDPQPASRVTDWMKRNAKAFETCEPSDGQVADLKPLRGMVGKARIVALGEGTHGTREFFQLKHRILQYLATEMDFTVFSIEANLPEAWRLNDYVLGGPGDARQLIAGIYFWTWNTEEVLEMVEWMRRFNASKKGRIEFTGFDMQFPDTAQAIVQRFLAVHEPAWSESVAALPAVTTGDPGFVTATGTLSASEFAGHKVRYTGFMRTENVTLYSGLWMRADSSGTRAIAFDNMASQRINGTTAWKRCAIELDIPSGTNNINFGVLMVAEGTAWFDSLAIEVDGKPWTSGNTDVGLEARLGRVPASPRFSIAWDDTARAGSRCLRLSGVPATGNAVDAGSAVAARRRLVDHLEASRARLAAATTPAQADWIIRNTHVVLQQAIGKGDWSGAVRDSCMAANVMWIADEARKGKKVVLWAHNMHVSKAAKPWMGKWLADRYGKDMVVVGFTANEGTYTAWKDAGVFAHNAMQPPPAGSLESFAHATGMPRFLLDLREARKDAEVVKLLGDVRMRGIGAMATEAQFGPVRLLDSYDILAWVDKTRASKCFGLTSERRP